jgi:hypothetical protein
MTVFILKIVNMKKNILLFVIVFLCFKSIGQSLSPEVIASGGDYFIGSNATLSWTLGEPITETYTAGGNILTQGFQQHNYNVTSINDPNHPDNSAIKINIYPNPAMENINIEISENINSDLCIFIYDLFGKNLYSSIFSIDKGNMSGFIKEVNLSSFAKGNYILEIYSLNGKFNKSYKIVKY